MMLTAAGRKEHIQHLRMQVREEAVSGNGKLLRFRFPASFVSGSVRESGCWARFRILRAATSTFRVRMSLHEGGKTEIKSAA